MSSAVLVLFAVKMDIIKAKGAQAWTLVCNRRKYHSCIKMMHHRRTNSPMD